jgi:hypothetical protein
VRIGDRASSQRWALPTTTKDIDRIKPVEELLAGSVSTFEITHASIVLVDDNRIFRSGRGSRRGPGLGMHGKRESRENSEDQAAD